MRTKSEASLRELYERLPAEIAAEMTFLQFADVVDRLSEAGLARDGKRGIRLAPQAARRGFLLNLSRHQSPHPPRSRPGPRRSSSAPRSKRNISRSCGTSALDRAVPVFKPQIAMFVGVAGGRKDVRLGDVVAAETVYDYESAKDTQSEYLPRIKTQSSSLSLVSEAWATARAGRWQDRAKADSLSPRPEAVVKLIASGSRVIADTRSGTAQVLDRYCSDAVAVDTESYGFLQAVAANPGIEGLVVRGISDLLTGKNEDSDQYWQPVAASHAAAFAFDLIDRLPHLALPQPGLL